MLHNLKKVTLVASKLQIYSTYALSLYIANICFLQS